jgi:hypothetical protein
MFMQIVIGMILQATVGKALAAAGTAFIAPIAAAQSLIWAAPATLATISSYGAAADAAPAELAAAIAAGELESVMGGAAKGGLIDGPGTGTSDSIPMMLSRGEYVIPASVVQSIGPDFFEKVRSGAIGAQDLYGNVMRGIARPITSDSDVAAKLPALGGGGGNQNYTVEGHKLNVALVHDRNQAKEFLATSEGEKQIVDIVTRKRTQIGIGT